MTDPSKPTPHINRRCTATCADGSPCRAWAVHGSDPPRCAPHGGGAAPVGAPTGNRNARKHGFYASIRSSPTGNTPGTRRAAAVIDLCIRHLCLTRYIDQHKHELSVNQLVHLCRLYSDNLSRIARVVAHRYGRQSPADLKVIFAHLLRQRDINTNSDP